MIEDKDYYELKDLVHILEERMKGEKRALELQALEYERRLQGLNHEAAKIETMKTDFVLVELHSKDIEAIRALLMSEVKELKTRIEPNTDYRTKEEGKNQLQKYIPWIISTLYLVAMYLMYKRVI